MKPETRNPKPETYFTPSNLYFFSIILLAVSLPLSLYLTSVAQFLLLASWLWSGNFKHKFTNLIKNKPAIILISLYFLHLIGLLWTNNFQYAFNDLRIKLPLLCLPVLIATSEPLSKKQLHIILHFFIAAVFFGTIAGLLVWLGNQHISDPRNISIFISHIRFSLLICFAIFLIIYFFQQSFNTHEIHIGKSLLTSLIYFAFIVWFVIFLTLLKSATGIGVLLGTLYLLLIFLTIKSWKTLAKFPFLLLVIAIPIILFIYIKGFIDKYYENQQKIDINNLEQYTAEGNKYDHNLQAKQRENGNFVWLYVQWGELASEWSKRSNIPFEGYDSKGQLIKGTLIRFLTSNGLRKDADGVKKLTDEEIRLIETGVTNVNYAHIGSFEARIYELIWEYDNYKSGENPSGHSLMQRLEYWKSAIFLIKEYFLIGVGSGDVQDAFNKYYHETNSPLAKEQRRRAHNQYLTFFITFGIFGMLWFIFTILYPLIWMIKSARSRQITNDNPYFTRNIFSIELSHKYPILFPYFVFLMIVVLSMLTEDTLETQAGATFYAFFNSLLLFNAANNNPPSLTNDQ